jgi:hypothetical protein
MSYTFTNVRAPHTIDIELEEAPYYIIQFGPDASQNAGGVVYPTYFPTALYYVAVDSGTVNYPFTIQADAGYEIDHLYVDGYSVTPSGTYTFPHIHAHHTIYATFKPVMFTINATTTVGGTIDPAGAVQVPQGTDRLFTIAPTSGYHIGDVSVDGVSQGAIGNYLFTDVQANHTIHAVFAVNTYTITPSAGANGNISPNTVQTVNHGANRTFNFIPATGYQVAQVFIDGAEDVGAAQSASYTFFNVTDSHTIHVTFMKQTYTITSVAGPNGTVTPLGVESVEYWDHSQIYTFDPEPGYHVKQVLIDGTNDPLAVFNQMHRFLYVTKNHTIHVFFAKDEYTITATAGQGGAINPSGIITVPSGTDRTFYFEPQAGFVIQQVIIDGINDLDAAAAGFYTFYDVSEDHIIDVLFEGSGYFVYLPTEVGVLVTSADGSASPVNYGGKYSFIVDKLEGYTQSNLVVRANGVALTPVANKYTINNITVDQIVTIEGINPNTYIIVAKSGNGGEITPQGNIPVTHGESRTFTITPNPKYSIDDVKVNGESEGALSTYTFDYVKGDATITAYFIWTPVGIEENGATITVFSNHNMVTIINEGLIPVKQVEIMDMYGRIVWTGQAAGAETHITLNVATGIYGVRIITEANEIATTKVSITK